MAELVGGSIPMQGQIVGGNQINPFEALKTMADTQRSLLSAQQQTQELGATRAASQIMSLYPDVESGFNAVKSNPALAPWIPQIYERLANVGRIEAETKRAQAGTTEIQQRVSNSALAPVFHSILSMGADKSPEENQQILNSGISIGRATISDPFMRGMFDEAVNGIKENVSSGGRAWTGEQLKSKVYALALANVSPEAAKLYQTGILGTGEEFPLSRPLGGGAGPGLGAPGLQAGPTFGAGGAPVVAPPAPATEPQAAPPGSTVAGPGAPSGAPGATPPAQPAPTLVAPPDKPDYTKLPTYMQPVTVPSRTAGGFVKDTAFGGRAQTLADEFNGPDMVRYQQATTSQQLIANLANTFNTLQDQGAWSQPGPFAPVRTMIQSGLKQLADMVDWKGTPPNVTTGVAVAEDTVNTTRIIGTNLVKQLLPGQREAQDLVEHSISAMPGLEHTWLGNQVMISVLGSMVDRTIDMHNFKMQWMADQAARGVVAPNLINAEEAFNRQNPPATYMRRALAGLGLDTNMTADKILQWERANVFDKKVGDAILQGNFNPDGSLKKGSTWAKTLGIE